MKSLKSSFEDILLLLLGCFTILVGSRAHSLVLAIMALWLTVQELQQMRIQKSKYVTVSNFTDVTVLILTAFVLFFPQTRLACGFLDDSFCLVSVCSTVTDLDTWLPS